MPIELSRKNINVKEKVLRETSTLWVENDIIISDSKPDIVKIIYAKGRAYISKTEVMDGRVRVDGKVVYNIIYQSTSDTMPNRGIIVSYPFTTVVSNSRIEAGSIVKTKVMLKKVITSVPNERKINAKSQIEVIVDVFKNRSVEVVDDINADGRNIEVTRVRENGINQVEYKVETLSGREDILIPIEKPNIYELLESDVKVGNIEYKLSYNKILVKGDMEIKLIYTGDDEKNSIITHTAVEPFAGFIDMQNLKENMNCNIEYNVENININAYDTADKANMVSVEYDINIMIETFEDMELEYISDFYGLDRDYTFETTQSRMVKGTNDIRRNETIIETVPVNVSRDSIVLGTNCNTENIEITYNNNDVSLNGMLNCSVLLYNQDSGEIENKEIEAVISKTINVDSILNSDNTDIKINIESINVEIQGDNLRVTANLAIDIIVSDFINVIGINNVEEIDSVSEVDGINLYIVNPGDTLWNIAKKYKTTVDNLVAINNIENPDKLDVGQKLIIVR